MNAKKLIHVGLLAVLIAMTAAMPASVVRARAGGRADALLKVEELVLQELTASGQTDYFVWMSEKADLSPAYGLTTKAEKGRFVFEALRATADRTQAGLLRVLDAAGARYEAFYIANKILVYGGSQELLLSIAVRPDVARVTANHRFQLQEPFPGETPAGLPLAVGANVSFIKAPQVWALGFTGQGTVLAGNDTGLDETHPAIARHYRGCLNPPTCSSWDHNYNWWDATGTYLTSPNDGHGHGTHTTGTMVGDDGGSNQIGVAPGATTIHCKNMTDGGSGSDATFTTCFQFDLAPWNLSHQSPDPAKAPDAVNNSWGYWGGGANQFRDEIQALHAAGILIEVSAGNEGPGCGTLRSPGDYWEVLTTGSVNHATAFPGSMTDFSSRGPSSLDGNYFPDITAPGENIRSSVPGGTYSSWSGTSMAGPHATALVGLIWSACPSYQGQVYPTIDLITQTATPVTGYTGTCGGNYVTGPNNDWGYGTIDALAAVSACSSPPVPPDAPTNLAATAVSDSQINLTWTDNADNESGFKIERGPDGVNFSEIAIVGANVTSYSNTGLTANTTYYYRVYAYNGAGSSAYSNTASATTLSGPPKMHVSSITLSYTVVRNKYKVTGLVTIVDADNQPVGSASVSAKWTYPPNKTKTASAATNSSGVATFTIQAGAGSYSLCVTNVTKTGYQYDPASNVVTCASRTVP